MSGDDVPWSGPEPEDKLPWAQDEPPSRPVRKPNFIRPKPVPFFAWIGGAMLPLPPTCPKCGSANVEYRKRDDSMWCRFDDEAFYHRSAMDILHAAGLWYL